MTSDAERREVARMLRDLPGDSTYPDLIGVIADRDGWYPAADAADRLADLIEPESERTCRVDSSHVEQEIGDYSYLEVELSCGHAFTWDDGTPPDYCPYCGARIIREETDDAD